MPIPIAIQETGANVLLHPGGRLDHEVLDELREAPGSIKGQGRSLDIDLRRRHEHRRGGLGMLLTARERTVATRAPIRGASVAPKHILEVMSFWQRLEIG